MKFLPAALLTSVVAAIFAPSTSLAQSAPCQGFSTFPLVTNLGSVDGKVLGESARCFSQKATLAINALADQRSRPNGIATLDGQGRLIGNQMPTSLAPTFIGMTQMSAVDTSLAGVVNPNAVLFAAGNRVSFCPALSCIKGPPNGSNNPAFYDHQRASLLVSAETQDDMNSQEQTVGITTTVSKGRLKSYAASTAYALGDNVLVGGAFGGAIYRVTQAGTTSASSPPPSGRPTSAPFTYMDGTARLLWINDSAIAAKVGLYNEVKVVPGGGNSWGQANNFELAPGVIPQNLHTSLELDFSNHSGTDCVAGIANCLGLYIRMAGANRNTAAISVEGVDASARSIFGARFSGPLAETTIDLGTTGVTGIGIGTFSTANYSSAAISDNSTAPAGLNITGTKSLAAIRLAANTSTGIALNDGTYSAWQIIGNGFSIDTVGNLVVPSARETISAPPASSSSPCSVGQRQWDASFEYRCVATNSWKRAALSSW